MKRCIAIVVLVMSAAAGCGKKQQAAPAAGSGAGSAAGDAIALAPVDQATRVTAGQALLTLSTHRVGALAPPAKATAAGRIIDATVAAMRRGSREAWDPAAVVARLGPDRDALFTWVRDRTALVPYRGSLRGPVGVMMDRVGNSLDRALLLAALLERAGRTVRLANAALDPDASARLAASWRARSRPALPDPVVDDQAFVAQLITETGVDPAAFRAGYLRYEAARADVVARSKARIAQQVTALAALVPAPKDLPAADPQDAAAALADHWWVQVEGEAEAWTDLDPSLPDALPGQALAPATETLAPNELAEDRRHRLTIRVIGEVWHDQIREEATLLEHTFAPAQFFGQRIVVTTVPIDMPPWSEVVADPHPAAAARTALSRQTEWLPALQIGTQVLAQKSVTDGGEVFDLADGNTNRLARMVQRATQHGVGGATDLMAQLPDDPSGPASPAKPPRAAASGFTAQWIEYELRAPGAEPTVVRRVVFDALGAGDRSIAKPIKLTEAAQLDRALALIGQVELLPMFAAIPEAFVNDRTAKALEDDRAALVEIAGLGAQPPRRRRSNGSPRSRRRQPRCTIWRSPASRGARSARGSTSIGSTCWSSRARWSRTGRAFACATGSTSSPTPSRPGPARPPIRAPSA